MPTDQGLPFRLLPEAAVFNYGQIAKALQKLKHFSATEDDERLPPVIAHDACLVTSDAKTRPAEAIFPCEATERRRIQLLRAGIWIDSDGNQ